jgi:hypothetical protein
MDVFFRVFPDVMLLCGVDDGHATELNKRGRYQSRVGHHPPSLNIRVLKLTVHHPRPIVVVFFIYYRFSIEERVPAEKNIQ